MASYDIGAIAAQRARMATVLFWVFVVIFVLTALFAFVALWLIFFDEKFFTLPARERFAWALWGAVLAEVAAGIFALWRNLFDLSSAGDVSDLSNTLSELIDGLEANGDISEEKAQDLRALYADRIGVSGLAKSHEG